MVSTVKILQQKHKLRPFAYLAYLAIFVLTAVSGFSKYNLFNNVS